MQRFLSALACSLALLPAQAACPEEAALALRFMQGYLAYNDAVFLGSSSQPVEAWLDANPLASPGLRKAYRAKQAEGLQRDPELGWGFDLLLDAQDYPEQGFELRRCPAPGYVELQGRGWPEFSVTVKTVRLGKALRIDGAGVLNIPPARRARQH
ncbi:hypothetical protein [Uliginosibacterium aquaticum]|uniref:DUF3828 domain-containing protein n=1 Tax=Uliginosibacterium aquaticum TaxID=2731212 RepID=A0ABX2ICL7_9RHOO|nr:hypothetical protein [Uliginosibacterium aquaticum]NSL53398.1 hypothetical protein [Uliginosibacterium aquaticum]